MVASTVSFASIMEQHQPTNPWALRQASHQHNRQLTPVLAPTRADHRGRRVTMPRLKREEALTETRIETSLDTFPSTSSTVDEGRTIRMKTSTEAINKSN
ncbi:MAG: hypothetical protein H0U76_07460 [Ktedonobacteraceae bacterium]|nr:hypothetical protein [Ktedonobacteraceae bacterium]